MTRKKTTTRDQGPKTEDPKPEALDTKKASKTEKATSQAEEKPKAEAPAKPKAPAKTKAPGPLEGTGETPEQEQPEPEAPKEAPEPPSKEATPTAEQPVEPTEPAADIANQTLGEAKDAFFTHLKVDRNQKEATLKTYMKDWELFEKFFEPVKKLASFKPANITNFLASDIHLKKPNGTLRAGPTIGKTARLLKMFLYWCEETGRIKKAPIPKDARMGGKSFQDIEDAAKAREEKKAAKKDALKKERQDQPRRGPRMMPVTVDTQPGEEDGKPEGPTEVKPEPPITPESELPPEKK